VDNFRMNFGLLVLRVGAGALIFFGHGMGKVSKLTNLSMVKFPDPLGIGVQMSFGLAAFAEGFCSVALVFGFLTRWVSIPLAITMAVAGFVVHAADPWSRKELALVYLVTFVALIFLGGGKYSVDGRLRRHGF